jgi:hypothetical protein
MGSDPTPDECGNARCERLEHEIEAQNRLVQGMEGSANLDRLPDVRNQLYRLRERLRTARIEMAASRAVPQAKVRHPSPLP